MQSVTHSELDQLNDAPAQDQRKRLPRSLTMPLIIALMVLTWAPIIGLVYFLVP